MINGYEVEILDAGEAECEVSSETDQAELSLNAFFGVDTPTTTKLMGFFGNVRAIVMIDSGATHNFVSPRVVEAAKLQVATDKRFQVLLGTGVTVDALGVCRGVTFSLQDAFFESDFVSLELGNVDVILEVQWLRCLGKCLVDWERHEWSFKHHGKTVTLRGDPALTQTAASLKALHVSDLAEVLEMGTTSVPDSVLLPSICSVLDKFQDVFAVPTGLLPLRGREHAIHLQPGVTAI